MWALGVAWVGSAIVCAQDAPQPSLFDTLRPGVTVVVKEHATSADLVEITVLDADYPPELLKEQARKIGDAVGSASRGVQVWSKPLDDTNARLSFLKATFATDHLIDRAQGVLRLAPIIRAFAGVAEPYTITGISVMFDGEAPSSQIVRTFASEALVVEGRATSTPPGIEYRVLLLSQNPEALDVPERVDSTPISPAARTNGSSRTVLIALCALAALAAGALVYLALMRNPTRGPK